MGKLLRIIISVLLTIIILIIAAIVIVVTLVNPNDYKDKISSIVKQQTGRELTIAGKIHWSLYPWLGVKVNDVTFGNAAGFSNKTFAKVGEADINVQLLPLFTGKVRAGTLTLKNVDLYLTKNRNGQTNWQDLLQKKSSAQLTTKTATTSKKEVTTKATLIAISGVNITNANIYWKNKQDNQAATIKNFNLNTSGIQLTKPIYIKSSFNFNTTNPNYTGKLNLAGKIAINLQTGIYSLKNLDIAATIKGDNLTPINFAFSGDASYNQKLNSFGITNLDTKINGMRIQGGIAGKQVNNRFTYSGHLMIPTFNPQPLLTNFGMQPQNSRSFRSFSTTLNFQGDNNSANVADIIITLDKSKLKGNISKIDWQHKILNFAFKLNQINLNNCQLKTTNRSKQQTKSTYRTITPAPYTPPQWRSNGLIRIGSLTTSKTTLRNFQARIKAYKGIINIHSIKANLYNGSLAGNITLNLQRKTPSFISNTAVTKIQLTPLLHDYGNTKKATGTLTFNAKLSGSGNTGDAILRTLNGNGKVKVDNGYLNGIDLKYQLRKAGAIYKKIVKNRSIHNIQDAMGLLHQVVSNKIAVDVPNTKQTHFGKLTGTFIIQNGLLHNNDLLISSPDYQVQGQGTANLPEQQLNYRVQVTGYHYDRRDGQTTKKTLPFPLTITIKGPFNDLRYLPDYSPIAKEAQKAAIKAVTSRTVQKIIKSKDVEKLRKQLNKTLSKFF